VLFLYRPEETKDLAPGDKIPTKLSIDKHRGGPLREFDLMFNGAQMQFRLLAKQTE
jgi:replicative DNA helicase